MRKDCSIYAAYKGDELQMLGTLEEIADGCGYKFSTVRRCAWNYKRGITEHYMLTVVFVGDES